MTIINNDRCYLGSHWSRGWMWSMATSRPLPNVWQFYARLGKWSVQFRWRFR